MDCCCYVCMLHQPPRLFFFFYQYNCRRHHKYWHRYCHCHRCCSGHPLRWRITRTRRIRRGTCVQLKENECVSLSPLPALCQTTPPLSYILPLYSIPFLLALTRHYLVLPFLSISYLNFLSLSCHSFPSSLLYLFHLLISFLTRTPGSGPTRERKVGSQCTYVQRNEEILSVTARSRRTPDRISSR